jgi:hypothetical protein
MVFEAKKIAILLKHPLFKGINKQIPKGLLII